MKKKTGKNGKTAGVFDDEEFIRDLWDGMVGQSPNEALGRYYKDLMDTRTYREFRNKVIDRTRKDPHFADYALLSLYPDWMNGYESYLASDTPLPFVKPEKMEELPLEYEQIPIEDIDANSAAVARLVGYAGKEGEDDSEILGRLYDDPYDQRLAKLKLYMRGVDNEHPDGDGSVAMRNRRNLLYALGMNPLTGAEDDYVFDAVLKDWLRSEKARNAKSLDFVKGFLYPHMHEKELQGLDASAKDLGADALSYLLPGKFFKAAAKGAGKATKAAKGAWSFLGLPLANEAIDFVHDVMVSPARKTYETGTGLRQEDVGVADGFKESLRPGERFGDILTTGLVGGLGIGRGGGWMARRLENTPPGKTAVKFWEWLNTPTFGLKERDARLAALDADIKRAKNRKGNAQRTIKGENELDVLDKAEVDLNGGSDLAMVRGMPNASDDEKFGELVRIRQKDAARAKKIAEKEKKVAQENAELERLEKERDLLLQTPLSGNVGNMLKKGGTVALRGLGNGLRSEMNNPAATPYYMDFLDFTRDALLGR